MPPALRMDIRERRDLLPGLTLVRRTQAGSAHERSLRCANDRHQAMLAAVAEGSNFLGLPVVDDGAVHERNQPRFGAELDERMPNDALDRLVRVLGQALRRSP